MNMDSGLLEYANAGHNPPYILRNNSSIHKLKSTGDIILGCFEDHLFHSKSIQLHPNDSLLLFTDGVTEAFNQDEDDYSEQRLEKLLSDLYSLDAKGIVNTIANDVNDFAGKVPQSDDITLMSLKYYG